MDADPRLAELGRLVAAYEQSHNHPNAFACCTAHAVADEVPGLIAELTETSIQLEIAERQNGKLADTVAGTGLALWEEERALARMRLAWQSARQRAAAYGEGILRQVSNREAWEGWAKDAQAEVARLQSLLVERDEQIAGLLADADSDFDERVVPA